MATLAHHPGHRNDKGDHRVLSRPSGRHRRGRSGRGLHRRTQRLPGGRPGAPRPRRTSTTGLRARTLRRLLAAQARSRPASPEDVQAFLRKYGNSVVGERMRGEWLKVLAVRGDWPQFKAQFPHGAVARSRNALLCGPGRHGGRVICPGWRRSGRCGRRAGTSRQRARRSSKRCWWAARSPPRMSGRACASPWKQARSDSRRSLQRICRLQTPLTRKCSMPLPTILVASSSSGHGARTIAQGEKSRCSPFTAWRESRHSRRVTSG